MKSIIKAAGTVLAIMLIYVTALAQKNLLLNTNTSQNTMRQAINETIVSGKMPTVSGKKGEFIIIADPKIKAENMVSIMEQYYRSQVKNVDTSAFYLIKPEWKNLSHKQKLEMIENEKIVYQQRADAVHQTNNQNQQLICMVNNTAHDVIIQMRDHSFIGVLEARVSKDNWRPVQYFQFSWCGNAYLIKKIAPGSTAYFITPTTSGNYKTKLRYKALAADQFYYSNEFEGNINYSDLNDTIHTPQQKLEAFVKYNHIN